jgi:hypothetical protein
MKMILSAAALVASVALSPIPPRDSNPDQAPVVRRVAATAQLAAQEYRMGIVGGRVVSPAEVDEARLFLQESRRSAALLPMTVRSQTLSEIDSLLALVNTHAAPDSVDARVKRLTGSLSAKLAVPLDEIPDELRLLPRRSRPR